jgi:GDPmannose 4,6-dehydratase
MPLRALITGVDGQDGSYLAEFLLGEGYEVIGTVRRTSHPNLSRLAGCIDDIQLLWMDLADATSVENVIATARPDEVYNLGAMSDVGVSFDIPDYSGQVTGLGAIRIIDSVRRQCPEARMYQAGSSEMFGMNPDVPTNERSEFHPASPYAVAKVFAHHSVVNYREAYGMFCVNGILFNHESPRRGIGFVTRKIAQAVARIHREGQGELILGTTETSRDWGHARDYVEAMWMMLQQDEPDDYVIATGETHTVQQFAKIAFDYVGLDWRKYVRVDPSTARPLDPPVLLGDPSKAKTELGWTPTVSFAELAGEMVEAELDA